MSSEKLIEGLGRRIDRRRMLAKVGAGVVGGLVALVGWTRDAAALCWYSCCLMCNCNSGGCGSCACTWCWSCTPGGGRMYRCCECYSASQVCDGGCPAKCSWAWCYSGCPFSPEG